MKITILFLGVLVCAIQITEQASDSDKDVKSTTAAAKTDAKGDNSTKENPLDILLYLANSLLRGDVIASLTKIVEVVQKQDTGLLLDVVLITMHRILTIFQPIFYILFPSTKDQGDAAMNFKSRLKTISHLMDMVMQ